MNMNTNHNSKFREGSRLNWLAYFVAHTTFMAKERPVHYELRLAPLRERTDGCEFGEMPLFS